MWKLFNLFSCRRKASLAVPGVGLALCGVGYDIVDLQNFKHRPCATGMNKGKGKRAVSSFFEEYEEDNEESSIANAEEESTASNGKKGTYIHTYTWLSNRLSLNYQCVIGYSSLSTVAAVSLSDEWKMFADELSSCDSDKLRLPQRAFNFVVRPNATADVKASSESEQLFSVVVDQSFGPVEIVVSDAEVLLAHYLAYHAAVVQGEITLQLGTMHNQQNCPPVYHTRTIYFV